MYPYYGVQPQYQSEYTPMPNPPHRFGNGNPLDAGRPPRQEYYAPPSYNPSPAPSGYPEYPYEDWTPTPVPFVSDQKSDRAYQAQELVYNERENKHDVQLQWTDLELSIKEKQILHHINGIAQPGRLFAIMGPSGSGKTSLLHCLAGRKKTGITGEVYLNSEVMTGTAMRHNAGFVLQDDQLFGFLSVEETIRFSAALQLRCGAEEREAAVNDVILRSGLEGVRKSKVGSVIVRGVSGGERRRVSVANEVVGDKPILFLDEPTSGLDSAAAYFVVSFLLRLARENGTAVVCTIHQPSAKVFDLFDDLLILAYGNVVYYGAAPDLDPHLARLGHAVPANSTPVEYAIDFINADFAEGDEKVIMKERIMEFAAQSMSLCAVPDGTPQKSSGVTHNTGVSFLRQLRVLLARGFLNAIRNWIFYWVRIAMLGMLAILSGTIWLNLGHSYASVQNRFGVLFFGVAFCCFMAVAGIPAYLEERGVMLREVHSGYYGPLAYTVASTMIMIPFLAILAMVYSVIAYWLQQLNPSASRFFTFYGIFFLVLFVAESMMLMWPALVPIFVIALTFASFFNGFVMMLMGYFVVYSSIPKFWIWGYYLSYQMYAFQAVCLNEFAGLTFDCLKSSSTNNTCSCLYVDSLNSQCQFSGDTVMVQYGYDGVCITCWAMVLLGMAIGYRIIFWLILEWRTRAALN